MQQVKDGKGIQVMVSGALAAFAVYMGALAVPIIVLMVMMVLDYLSGMAAAWMQNNLSSKIGAKGIIKKVGYMGNIDISYNMWFGLLVAVWLIINEMISILENLSKLGVPIPDFMTKLIKRLKSAADGGKENG